MDHAAPTKVTTTVEATVIRADGTRENLGTIAREERKLTASAWQRFRQVVARSGIERGVS